MKLIYIIAEWKYLKDCVGDRLSNEDSNVRDYYHREAYSEVHELISSYLALNGWLGNLVRGCIDDFINVHGGYLLSDNRESLVKRIVSNIKGRVKNGE